MKCVAAGRVEGGEIKMRVAPEYLQELHTAEQYAMHRLWDAMLDVYRQAQKQSPAIQSREMQAAVTVCDGAAAAYDAAIARCIEAESAP